MAGVAFRLGHGVTQGAAAVGEDAAEQSVAGVQPPAVTILSNLDDGRLTLDRDGHQ